MRKDQEPNGYQVGYGKPPVENQFKKGQSGNPKGRPRKARKEARNAMSCSIDRIILEEAMQPMTVREGDKLIEMPAIQVVLRQLRNEAAKGSSRAQRMFLEMTNSADARAQASKEEWLKTAVEYKLRWGPIFARCRERGEPVPNRLPDPDHVIINARTDTVEIVGPMTPEEKEVYDEAIETARDLLDAVATLRRKLEKDPHNKSLQQALKYYEKKADNLLR